jgi:hypothetical protein
MMHDLGNGQRAVLRITCGLATIALVEEDVPVLFEE